MNIRQRIEAHPDHHARVTSQQVKELWTLCTAAERLTFAENTTNSGRGVVAIIKGTRVLETDVAPTWPEQLQDPGVPQ